MLFADRKAPRHYREPLSTRTRNRVNWWREERGPFGEFIDWSFMAMGFLLVAFGFWWFGAHWMVSWAIIGLGAIILYEPMKHAWPKRK